MGLIKQLIRAIKRILSNVFGFLTRRDSKRKRRERLQQPPTVPRSWGKKEEAMTHRATELPRIKYKRKIPGLRMINRFLAGIWLLINFVFSQFLLGSIGSQAQWTFIFFLGNCYFIIKYLWGSRRGDSQPKT